MKSNRTLNLSNSWLLSLALILILGSVSSCTSLGELKYFADLPNTESMSLPDFKPLDRLIERGDEINIFVNAADSGAVRPFTKLSGSGSLYKVSNEGTIDMPVIGQVIVMGKTDKEIKAMITKSISTYVKNPLVDVTFSTFRISILGEVKSPGTYTLPYTYNTIFHALAAAGDLPMTALRYDIKLFRDVNGKRTITTIDLREKRVLTDPTLFQIMPNDVLYVQPSKSALQKQNITSSASVLSIITSAVALTLTIMLQLKKI